MIPPRNAGNTEKQKGHNMETRDTRALCGDCKWVDETDSVKNYHFRGVELCAKHAPVPVMAAKKTPERAAAERAYVEREYALLDNLNVWDLAWALLAREAAESTDSDLIDPDTLEECG